MNKDLVAIFEYLEREKGVKREVVIAAIEESLRAAARKSVQGLGNGNVTVHINPKSGDIEVFCEKEIIAEVTEPSEEISLEAARAFDPDCEIGQVLDVPVTPKNFGRIAAQTARQIISQKLRSAERDVIYEEYRHRVNEIVSGSVKRFARGANLVVDLGKVEALLPARHYPKTEHYHIGDKILALLLEVQDLENGGAEVILSRGHPEFVKQLLIQEVPEISDGVVVVEKIVREPGYRTKLLVRSLDSKVDPVGACVGIRGTRVKNIVRELNNEKIDIIPYADDPVELLQNALSPMEIRKIRINEEDSIISIVVNDDDFATVIGKKGMNARLTGQMIGAMLEVQKMSDYGKLMAIQQGQLLASEDTTLDEPLVMDLGINKLVMQNLVHAGFDTPRKILSSTPEELARIPGITVETAYNILEHVSKQRK